VRRSGSDAAAAPAFPMSGFSIAVGQGFAGHTVERWRADSELKSSMAYAKLGPRYIPGAKMYFRVASLGDLVVSATVASSPLVYETIPTRTQRDPARHFYLFMPNEPRSVTVGDERFVQRAGECVLADSAMRVIGEYESAHAGVCLSIPFEFLARYLTMPADAGPLRLGRHGVLSRLVSRLLLTVWHAAEQDVTADGSDAAHVLLRLIAHGYGDAVQHGRTDEVRRLRCEQVKEIVGAQLRNPALTVQAVAEQVGVTTRYLQLLFAQEGECVSEYIRRERLRACMIDLRNADFDRRSITEIAFSWGFNSAAHFSAVFRREFGLSPRDYRRCDLDRLADALGDETEGPVVRALQLVSRRSAGTQTVLAA
jgi:AraC-like DNA-binding protein